MNNKKILIIRLSALGDVAMTIPAIYSFALHYPSWTVTVLTQPFFSRLFLEKPNNVRLLTVEKKDLKSLAGMIRLLKCLNDEHFFAIADFHNVLRSWILDLFFIIKGKKVRILNKNRLSRFNIIYKKRKARLFTDRYFDVLKSLGFEIPNDYKPFFQGNVDKPENETIMIGVAPFARYKNKTYPLKLMKELVNSLANKGYSIWLFGSKGEEQAILEGWHRNMQKENIRVVAGHYSIEEELKLMAHMKIMITMDSANMHLASLVGTKVVSIWGSTTPACGFLGYQQKYNNIICLELSCQPCSIAGGEKCKRGKMDCLINISPIMIVDKIESLICYGSNK